MFIAPPPPLPVASRTKFTTTCCTRQWNRDYWSALNGEYSLARTLGRQWGESCICDCACGRSRVLYLCVCVHMFFLNQTRASFHFMRLIKRIYRRHATNELSRSKRFNVASICSAIQSTFQCNSTCARVLSWYFYRLINDTLYNVIIAVYNRVYTFSRIFQGKARSVNCNGRFVNVPFWGIWGFKEDEILLSAMGLYKKG